MKVKKILVTLFLIMIITSTVGCEENQNQDIVNNSHLNNDEIERVNEEPLIIIPDNDSHSEIPKENIKTFPNE